MNVKQLDDAGVEVLRKFAHAAFTRYVQQRDAIDEAYEISDWQYRGGTHRGTYDKEKRKWVPRYAEGKANVGSSLAHRQVNTLAGILGAILLSGRDLWRYSDKKVNGVNLSDETGALRADAMNALMKVLWKWGEFERIMPEFCVSVFKDSNVFAHIGMRRERRRVVEVKDVATRTGRVLENGDPEYVLERKVRYSDRDEVAYPVVTFPYPRNVYADANIPNIRDQECVIVLSLTTKQKLFRERKWLDMDALLGVDEKELYWDGKYGGDAMRETAENMGRGDMPSVAGGILRWDVYAWLPMVDGKVYDAEAGQVRADDKDGENDRVDMALWWGVFVGNTLERAVCLKAVTDFDPDGEIPIKEIRALPDNGDMLYHSFIGEVIRALYAADCALMNASIDANAIANDPPTMILHGQHMVKDFTLRPGQKWVVRVPGAIQPYPTRDATVNNVALREQIRDDARLALGTDNARLGEYAGSRTTAYEIARVTGSTDNTIALRNAYIVGQLLPWLARKYASYCAAYMDPKDVQAILNEVLPAPVDTGKIGEYDIVVDIVGRYEDDESTLSGLREVLQIIARQPQLAESDTHRVNVGELLRMYCERLNVPVAKLLDQPRATDSESNARNRIQLMLLTGVYLPPKEGENLSVHRRVAAAERIRWRGVDPAQDERAANVHLLDQYMADCDRLEAARAEAVMETVRLAQEAIAGGAGGPPVGPEQAVGAATGVVA